MAKEGYKRKLTAIFSADVEGYSRLMGENEVATVETLKQYREVIFNFIARHLGRVIDSPGDNLLAEFRSVVDAVRCAVELQKDLIIRNEKVSPDRRMAFRIGINLGDVLDDGIHIYGDGVNIAARVEKLAEGGGVCISGSAYDQVNNKLEIGFEYLGKQQVKNIAEPIRAYRIRFDPSNPGETVFKSKKKDSRYLGKFIWGFVILVGIAAVSAVTYRLQFNKDDRMAHTPFSFMKRLAAGSSVIPSVAVLPFTNMSGDPDQEYFADGFTEDLITDLSKVSELLVIARNSVFVYKGKNIKIEEVGKDLGVRYILEGSVRKEGGKVRINAQLIDVKTGGHIWADRYDRKIEDIFDLQDEVSQKIVTALALKLTEGEQERLLKKETANLEAYDAYLRGLEFYSRFTRESNAQARTYFEKASGLDPAFASALSKLGWTYFADWVMGWSQDRKSLQIAMEKAQNALSANKASFEGQCLAASVLLWEKKHDEAIATYQKALDLNPNYAEACSGLGDALAWAGRPEEAIPLIEEAIRLNPSHPAYYEFNLGHAYFLIRQYDKAIATLKKSLSINSDFFPSRIFMAAAYSEMGKIEDAITTLRPILDRYDKDSMKTLGTRLPYKDPRILQRILDALSKAGLQ